MPYLVYIIESENNRILYKGYTTDIEKRLYEHNNNLSRYTSGKGPWKLVYLETFEEKRSALIREKQLKRSNKDYLQRLIEGYLKTKL
jgi:putative endonuclease